MPRSIVAISGTRGNLEQADTIKLFLKADAAAIPKVLLAPRGTMPMRVLIGMLKIAGLTLALIAWGLTIDLLWGHGYKLPALLAFYIVPYGLFELARVQAP